MNLKELIEQINQELTNLKTKITTKLADKDQVIANQDQTINEKQDQIQAEQRKVETMAKENADNEATLNNLLQSMQELTAELDK